VQQRGYGAGSPPVRFTRRRLLLSSFRPSNGLVDCKGGRYCTA
jgi:hypothetical protein